MSDHSSRSFSSFPLSPRERKRSLVRQSCSRTLLCFCSVCASRFCPRSLRGGRRGEAEQGGAEAAVGSARSDRVVFVFASASAIRPAASVLLRGAVRVLSICLEALAMLLSLVPSPARLQRRWRAAAAALKTLLTTKASSSASALPTDNRNNTRGPTPAEAGDRGRRDPRRGRRG